MNLTFGPPKVQGNMAVEAVAGAVASKGPALASCAPVGSNGSLLAVLTLKGDGSVATATVTSSGLTPAIEACVGNQVRGWVFSKPRGGIARLEVPITFATR